jgi:molecular chaperone HscC
LKVVGIDLGTTNSLIAVMENGTPKLISNISAKFLTPSVVGAVKDTGYIIVGQSANEYSILYPNNCISNFKRLMGLNQKFSLDGKEYSPPELSSFVLKSLKEDAEKYLKEEVRDAVITVPAYFNDSQRKATKLAGELAGLKVRRIINEPTAAALSYGLKNAETSKKVLVFDLGGGTFDVTIMDISDGVMEILSTAGVHDLGGEDFTNAILYWVLKQKKIFLERAEHQMPKFIAKLKDLCNLAKIQLSDLDSAKIKIPDENGQIEPDSDEIELTIQQFEEISNSLIRRLDEPFQRAIRDSRLQIKEIDEIILAGGATRMKVISNYLLLNSSVKPIMHANPDYVVALGAAIQGAMLDNDDSVDDLVMTDICPHSLGVNICKSKGGQYVNGYFLPVIHRGTIIPVSREEVVATLDHNQQELKIEIFQGESRRVSENHKLGELLVQDIPKAPAGQNIILRFTYDPSNILEVEVIIPLNNTRKNLVINNQPGGLTEAEIQKAIERLSKIKYYPRENLKNLDLLTFAEKCVKETAPHQRDQLEHAIDIYENLLHSNTINEFEESRNHLIMTLHSLGYFYDAK